MISEVVSINPENDDRTDDKQPQIEPLRQRRADLPARSQPFFDAAPTLAVHDGPWTHSHRPRLGAALKVGALVAGVLTAALVVLDQVRAETLLEGDLVVAGFAGAFLVMIIIGSPGISLSRGKIRYQPSGRTLAEHREEYPGSIALGSAVHSALSRRAITHREILAMSRAGASDGRLVVSLYWSPRDDLAFAAVHLRITDEEFTLWPPAQIPRDRVAGLTSSEPNTFDVAAATQ